MNKYKFFYRLPRILAIVYISFLTLFALDVFIPGQIISYYLAALFMHLIPNFILAFILIIAWRIEKLGGLIFILFSLLMTVFFNNPFWVNLILSGPLLLIGALFFINGYFFSKGRRWLFWI